MIQVEKLGLGDAAILRNQRFPDARGWFSETYSARWLAEIGPELNFVQDNMSWSEKERTLRGLHAQQPPMAQAKLVSVISGAIFDVLIDCRNGSPTFGQLRTVELCAEDPVLLYVPAGFCHGFLTQKPGTLVSYKVDNFYSREHETGIRWNDPTLQIPWPLNGAQPVVSSKDAELPSFANFAAL